MFKEFSSLSSIGKLFQSIGPAMAYAERPMPISFFIRSWLVQKVL